MKRGVEWAALVGGIGLIIAAWSKGINLDVVETVGVVAGATCVYLGIKQSVWNFPVGIINNIFFLILFTRARIYGDAGLQIVYLALAIHGWYLWSRGGEGHSKLKVTRGSKRLLTGVGVAVVAATLLLNHGLEYVRGAAPLLDALTTSLSLAAQFLLNRKIIEHWVVWIVADVIYIYLYISRGLNLTALLYAVFICLCVAGFIAWRRSMLETRIALQTSAAEA